MLRTANDRRILGLDLDNTVIDYAAAYRELSRDFGLPENCETREAIRETLRSSSVADEQWQRFQSILYTDGLDLAQPSEGILPLLEACQFAGIPVVIISHKTMKGPERFGARDLHAPARDWLVRNGIAPGLIPASGVTFHSTATEKVNQVARIAPCWFVDDLEEILLMEGFPPGVRRILYRKGSPWLERANGTVAAGFGAIMERIII